MVFLRNLQYFVLYFFTDKNFKKLPNIKVVKRFKTFTKIPYFIWFTQKIKSKNLINHTKTRCFGVKINFSQASASKASVCEIFNFFDKYFTLSWLRHLEECFPLGCQVGDRRVFRWWRHQNGRLSYVKNMYNSQTTYRIGINFFFVWKI